MDVFPDKDYESLSGTWDVGIASTKKKEVSLYLADKDYESLSGTLITLCANGDYSN